MQSFSGCSVARSSRLVWDQEVASSNLATPTDKSFLHCRRDFLFTEISELAQDISVKQKIPASPEAEGFCLNQTPKKITEGNLAIFIEIIFMITEVDHEILIKIFFPLKDHRR